MPASLRVEPSAADSGIIFVRSDVPGGIEIPAHVEHVVDARRCVTLGRSGVSIRTVEHLVASLMALGVDNARVVADGPEIPILDGSARDFVGRIRQVGLVELDAPRRGLVVTRTVGVEEGDRWVRLEPAASFSVACTIEFAHPLVREQHFDVEVTPTAFEREIAGARTFGFSCDAERLRAAGLALGASLDNALVFDEEAVANQEGARFVDEPVRHKVLDAIGDLALLGAPLRARYVGHKSGHALNVRLMNRLLADRDQFKWEVQSNPYGALTGELNSP